jgi:hypothetical protein
MALASLAVASSPGAECVPGSSEASRTFVLALDGVPFRVVERAREQGAFAGWPATSRLIAPFPSVTNVSFSEMLQPAGVGPAPGYEFSHFDRERNAKVNSSPFHYSERSFAWRDEFDAIGRTLGSKLAIYTHPRKKAKRELAEAEKALFESSEDLVLAHVGSTDALQHLRGDEATLQLLMQLDEWIPRLRRLHEERLDRPLRIVLLSDHGNTSGKIDGARGFKRRLRKAGLNVAGSLETDKDVVTTTFGVVSYGALFLAPEQAERAARAVADHQAVAFAVWSSGPRELSLVSVEGNATIHWRDRRGRREFAYRTLDGDPLKLEPIVSSLAVESLLDADGFADGRDWLLHSASADYPDAPYRLVESLTGDHLVNHASVLFSLRPGRSWGWKSAKAGSWLRGGHLEGTHGGLDHDSSAGFFLAETASWMPDAGVVRAGEALVTQLALRARQAACHSERTGVVVTQRAFHQD